MGIFFVSILAVLCGSAIAVQAATNSVLLNHLGAVTWVAIALFSIGLVYLLLLALFSSTPMPNLTYFSNAPIWSYVGGIVVASYVVAITYFVPRLGVGNAIFLIVCGQVIASVIIDHFGLFGVETKEFSYTRLAGCVALVSGVLLAKS